MLGSADIASSLAAGVRYQASGDAHRDSPAKLKTTAKSPSAPVQPIGAQAAQGQGIRTGATPPSDRDIVRQKRLQRFASDTSDKSDCNPVQGVVMERTASSGSVQSPLLSPSAAATDSRPSGLRFEVGNVIQVDRPDSAPWYGVIRWMGTLPGSSILSAGIEMVHVDYIEMSLLLVPPQISAKERIIYPPLFLSSSPGPFPAFQ